MIPSPMLHEALAGLFFVNYTGMRLCGRGENPGFEMSIPRSHPYYTATGQNAIFHFTKLHICAKSTLLHTSKSNNE